MIQKTQFAYQKCPGRRWPAVPGRRLRWAAVRSGVATGSGRSASRGRHYSYRRRRDVGRGDGAGEGRRRTVDGLTGGGLLLIQETEKNFQDTENMSNHLLPYLANCSLLFTEEPLLQRPAAARAAGFSAVEFWWPFATPVPADREVDAFAAAIEEAGVALVGLNFFAGDLAGPDCAVLSIPGRGGP